MDAFEFVTNEKEQFSSEDPKLPDQRLYSYNSMTLSFVTVSTSSRTEFLFFLFLPYMMKKPLLSVVTFFFKVDIQQTINNYVTASDSVILCSIYPRE
jgi:hypothetical protein